MDARINLLRALMLPEGYADGGVVGLFQPAFTPAGGEAGGMSGAGDPEGSNAYGGPQAPNSSTWGAYDAAVNSFGPNSAEAISAAADAQSGARAMAEAVNSPVGQALGAVAPGFGTFGSLAGVMSGLAASSRGLAPAGNWGKQTNAITSALMDLFGFAPTGYGTAAAPGTNDSNPNGFNAARGLAQALDALGLADQETQNALDASGRAKDPVGYGPHDVGPNNGAGFGPGPDGPAGRDSGMGDPAGPDAGGYAEGGPILPPDFGDFLPQISLAMAQKLPSMYEPPARQSRRLPYGAANNPAHDTVPIMASPGEFVMDRESIMKAGGGDLSRGLAFFKGLQQMLQRGAAPRGVI